MIAAEKGFDDLVSLLLDQKSIMPDLQCLHSNRCFTASLVAIDFGQQGCFRLLPHRSDRGAKDRHGQGAMWLAAASGHTSIVSELLKWPEVKLEYADISLCGNPLTEAARGNHQEAALLLLPHIKQKSYSSCGITPIHCATLVGSHGLPEQILAQDASLVDHKVDFEVHKP